MSGGAWNYIQRRFSDVGRSADMVKANPVLAELIEDVSRVIDKVDWWVCGDSGHESADVEWRAFCEKWYPRLEKESKVDDWKPCPFCGGIGKLSTKEDKYFRHVITCRDCNASMEDRDLCDLKIKWNKRMNEERI